MDGILSYNVTPHLTLNMRFNDSDSDNECLKKLDTISLLVSKKKVINLMNFFSKKMVTGVGVPKGILEAKPEDTNRPVVINTDHVRPDKFDLDLKKFNVVPDDKVETANYLVKQIMGLGRTITAVDTAKLGLCSTTKNHLDFLSMVLVNTDVINSRGYDKGRFVQSGYSLKYER